MADMKTGAFPHDNMPTPESDLVLPLFSLKGRTAIVSGAGAGIGLAIAQGFAEAGANVAIWYNSNKKALDEAAKIEEKFGVKCEQDLLVPYHWPLPHLPTNDPTKSLYTGAQARPTR
jgi:sorbose reductase